MRLWSLCIFVLTLNLIISVHAWIYTFFLHKYSPLYNTRLLNYHRNYLHVAAIEISKFTILYLLTVFFTFWNLYLNDIHLNVSFIFICEVSFIVLKFPHMGPPQMIFLQKIHLKWLIFYKAIETCTSLVMFVGNFVLSLLFVHSNVCFVLRNRQTENSDNTHVSQYWCPSIFCVRFVRPSHVSCHKSSMMLSNDEESKSPYRTLWTPGPYWRQRDTMRVIILIMDIIETLQWRHGHKTKCGWNKKLGKTYSDQKPKYIAWTREVGIYKDLHTYVHTSTDAVCSFWIAYIIYTFRWVYLDNNVKIWNILFEIQY